MVKYSTGTNVLSPISIYVNLKKETKYKAAKGGFIHLLKQQQEK